jgi:alpha-aminoadipic semialdehyde synthase
VIFGVKEVPIDNLLPNKTYFMFSHTIKAQGYNMLFLDKLLEKNLRVIDFECIRDNKSEKHERLVAFGRYAGIAGAFDFIRGCGEFLLQKGYQTPLVFLGSSYMYEDYSAMQEALSRVSSNIERGGLPRDASPMVFAVTGTGRVSNGILEVLGLLPHDRVEPDDLESYLESKKGDKASCKKIVICVFQAKDLVEPKVPSEEPFNKKHYYREPNKYQSKFYKYLPFVSWLLNGIYWEPKYPRVLTKKELLRAHESGTLRLMGVTDISADYEGSIEFTSEFTSIEEPFLLWDIHK